MKLLRAHTHFVLFAASWLQGMKGPGKVTGCHESFSPPDLVSAPSSPAPRTNSHVPFKRTELVRVPSDSRPMAGIAPSRSAKTPSIWPRG